MYESATKPPEFNSWGLTTCMKAFIELYDADLIYGQIPSENRCECVGQQLHFASWALYNIGWRLWNAWQCYWGGGRNFSSVGIKWLKLNGKHIWKSDSLFVQSDIKQEFFFLSGPDYWRKEILVLLITEWWNLLEFILHCCDSSLKCIFLFHLLLHVSYCFPPQALQPLYLFLSLIHLPL